MRIKNTVKSLPISSDGCTSLKPTVETVITVMNKASIHVYSGEISLKPTIPTINTKAININAM